MSELEMRSQDRPKPAKDHITTEYWDATLRGELLIQRCPSCGHRQHYPRLLCTACGETPAWERASGRGTVHTFTVIRQNHAKPFRDLLPYVVAMVALDEGPMLMGNVVGCAVDDVRIDMAVEVVFETVVDDDGNATHAVPYWRPA
ncbi:MAG: uncharacterized protein QOE63_846 [Acidimicrobiaceae bacterium]